jgi:hypothetical protein
MIHKIITAITEQESLARSCDDPYVLVSPRQTQNPCNRRKQEIGDLVGQIDSQK